MNLIKIITTSKLAIHIYSTNNNLNINDNIELFENKNDNEIQEIVFHQLGADQVDIYDLNGGQAINLRSYAVI